jgi:hypothetical protein
LDHERLRELSLGKDLNQLSLSAHKAFIHQDLGRNGFCRLQISQTFQINDGVFGSKLIRESILRDSSDQRHLTAFETWALAAT